MAYDPSIPDDVKKRFNNGVRGNVLPNAMYPQPGQFDSVQAGSATNNGTIAPTPDAVAAGPVRPGVIFNDAKTAGVAPPSPLDATQPLPAGVRQYKSAGYQGTPGTNDVIYEGRGANGERSFSNNQFAGTLTGRGAGVNPGLDALQTRRHDEISGYLGSQQAAANAAAGAAAIAPKTADEQTSRIKALTDRTVALNGLPDKGRAAALDAAGKAGENINNDPFTKTSDTVRDAALKGGAAPEAAVQRGYAAAATQALNAGLDPSDKTLPPAARAGDTGVRRQIADLINTAPTTGFAGGFTNREGLITDPDAFDPSKLELGVTPLTHYPTLRGPKDSNGNVREIVLSSDQAQQLTPYVQAARRAGLQRRSLVSDSK